MAARDRATVAERSYDPSRVYSVDEIVSYRSDLAGKTLAITGKVICVENYCSLYSENGTHIDLDMSIMSNRSKLKVFSSNHNNITVMGYTSKYVTFYGDAFYGTEVVS